MPDQVIKLLLVEDDEDDYLITKHILEEIGSRKFQLDWASNAESGAAAIARYEHDIYLIDYRLGSENGLDLLRQAVQSGCPAPIILLTGLGTPEIDREAMSAGAADYLVKGQITPDLLVRSINHSIQRKQTELKLRASEERLRQAQKLEAIGTLAGGIAHDFNNILAIISGYASRLKATLPPEQLAQNVTAIQQSVQRGAALVRQILTFARKTEFTLEHANVNSVLKELVHMLQETFPKTIQFDLQLDESLQPLTGDVSQLHQTFLNLCVNARDAMPNGGTISISTRLKTINGQRLAEVIVRDNGVGMDSQTRARIFEPFFTTKGREGGTGLGLAVVYGIVNHHGGTIEVDSDPGRGTMFKLTFPVTSKERENEPAEFASIAQNLIGSERILFVEDEELLLDLMRELLQEQGYRVIVAKDGLEAIEVFSKQRAEIDLVVTDMGLPGLGGWEVFLRIREIDPNAKVLLASGYLDPDMKAKMLRAGAADLLQKPYVPSELFQRIRKALDQPGGAIGG